MRWFYAIIAVLLLLAIPQKAVSERTGLSIAGVQLYIDESMYKSVDEFSHTIEKELREAISTPETQAPPDLVVFPEYTSVFLALTPYSQKISTADTVADALSAILTNNTDVESLNDIFVLQAGRVESDMDRVWGGLARRYGVAILAGTYFAEESGVLRNRLIVYDRSGRRLYEQDKVYLTQLRQFGLSIDKIRLNSPFLKN